MAECIPPSTQFSTRAECVPNPNADEVSWRTENDEFSPFIDPRNCRYSIVVDKAYVEPGNTSQIIQYESLGPSSIRPTRIRTYAEYGVDRLIQFFSKNPTEEERANLINSAIRNFSEEGDNISYVIPTRPRSKMKVLITVPYNRFRNVADIEYVPRYSESVEVITAKYDVRLMKAQIEFVSNIIKENYREKRGIFRNTSVDLELEAEKMMSFLSALQRFLNYNEIGVDLNAVDDTREEFVELIIDQKTYKLLDIIYTFQNGEEKYLRSAWPTMVPQVRRVLTPTGEISEIDYYPSETSPTTIALIYWTIEELFLLFNNHIIPSSKRFIERYIFPPVDTNQAIGSSFNLNQSHLRQLDDGIQKAAQVLGIVDYGFDVLNSEESLLPLADNYIKTWAELQLENDSILGQAFQSNMANQTNDVVRITDSSPFIDWATVWDRMDGNIENLYHLVLNHVDVRYIMAKLAQCSVSTAIDAFEIDPVLLEILRRLTEFLLWLANMDYSTFRFPSDWLALGLDITEDLVNYIANFLINLVNIALTEGILSLLKELDELCEDDLDYSSIDISTLIGSNFDSPEDTISFYDTLANNLGDGAPGGLLRELVRDISAVLSTPELCSLLSGAASGEVLTIAYNIVLLNKYSAFHQRFATKNDVAGFFESLGKLFDPSICEIGTEVPPAEEFCAPNTGEQIRRALLSNRGGITPDQIEQQIESERRRRAELLEKFDEIINSTEGDLSQKLLDVLSEGEINRQISGHPSTEEVVNQMVQTLFVAPMTTMLNEGLGALETRYTSIEYGTGVPGFGPQLDFALNKGIMDVVSSAEGYSFSSFGVTTGQPSFESDPSTFREGGIVSGDGLIEQLSQINLNANTTPQITKRVTIEDPADFPSSWSYGINLHRIIGGFSVSPLAEQDIIYETAGSVFPTWWDLPPGLTQMDNPQIRTFFIEREPLAGLPSPLRENVPGPSLNLNDESERNVYLQPSDQYLKASRDVVIDVFTDFPEILEQTIAFEELAPATVGNKQQQIYVNSFIKYASRLTTTLDSRITNLTATRNIASTYQNVYNDVMRTLYKFTADSLTNATNDYIIVPALRRKFKDPVEVTKLLGLQDIEETIQNNLADVMTRNEGLDKASKDVIGESALRFLIRIYLVEVFVKNIHTFINMPEITTQYGNTIIKSTADISPPREVEIGINNPAPSEGGSTRFFNRTLDLTAIQDSVLVSYIAEYIKFSDERVDSCSAFFDIAESLAEEELSRTEADRLQAASGVLGDDTLAYYPDPKAGVSNRDAALKYYVAKEMKTFLNTLQEFVELKDLIEYPVGTDKRSLMEAFLDKFQILGHNIETEGFFDWERYGEGLYMDFYLRASLTEEEDEMVHLFSSLYDSESRPQYFFADDDKVGLRVNIRDSQYHSVEADEFLVSTDIRKIMEEHFSFADENGVSAREATWSSEKGFPIIEIERAWGQIREATGISNNAPYTDIRTQRQVLDYMKRQMVQSTEFRLLFEYAFPVKKMFNFLMIIMDQNVSAFLTNTKIRGVKLEEAINTGVPDLPPIDRRSILNPSCIDPEQFINAKGIAKSILENVVNSDNYRYINGEIQEAGGIANLVLSNSLESL